jgi:hypothetical protein
MPAGANPVNFWPIRSSSIILRVLRFLWPYLNLIGLGVRRGSVDRRPRHERGSDGAEQVSGLGRAPVGRVPVEATRSERSQVSEEGPERRTRGLVKALREDPLLQEAAGRSRALQNGRKHNCLMCII